MLEDIFFSLATAAATEVRDVVEVGIAESTFGGPVHDTIILALAYETAPSLTDDSQTNRPHPPPADRMSWLRENETSAMSTAALQLRYSR